MHKSLEDFTEECFRFFQYLNVQSLKLKLQLSLQVFASQPAFGVVVKLLTLETILLKNLNVVRGLILHASNGIKHVAIVVSNWWDSFGRIWNDTWVCHDFPMLLLFYNHLLFDQSSLLQLVLEMCIWLFAGSFSSLSPIFIVIFVVVNQESEIWSLEIFSFLLIDDNKDGSQFLWVVITSFIYRCDEFTLTNLLDLLVDAITQIFLI